MTRRRKRGGTSGERGVEEKRGKIGHTSRAMLNFLARSLTLSSRVKPVIIPFILGSARGDRFPTGQLYLNHESHSIPCYIVSFLYLTKEIAYQVRIEMKVLGQLS